MIGQVYPVSFDNSGFSDSALLDYICLAGIYWIWCLGGGSAGQGSPGFVGWDLLGWLGRFCLLESGFLGQV